MNGLEEVELIPQGRLGRLFGKKIEENAYREVNNMLAASPIFQIYHDGVLAVLRSYGLTFESARPRLIEIYTKVLGHFGRSGELTELDRQHMERLAELFGIPVEVALQINADTLPALRAQPKS